MGNPGSSAKALPTGRACRVAQQFCQLHPREPWNGSRLFPVQIWRQMGEAGPTLWACRNSGR